MSIDFTYAATQHESKEYTYGCILIRTEREITSNDLENISKVGRIVFLKPLVVRLKGMAEMCIILSNMEDNTCVATVPNRKVGANLVELLTMDNMHDVKFFYMKSLAVEPHALIEITKDNIREISESIGHVKEQEQTEIPDDSSSSEEEREADNNCIVL